MSNDYDKASEEYENLNKTLQDLERIIESLQDTVEWRKKVHYRLDDVWAGVRSEHAVELRDDFADSVAELSTKEQKLRALYHNVSRARKDFELDGDWIIGDSARHP